VFGVSAALAIFYAPLVIPGNLLVPLVLMTLVDKSLVLAG
jgi:hypothetical protein